MKSQEILPIEERFTALSCWENNVMVEVIRYFNLFYKALEAAEEEILKLQNELETLDNLPIKEYDRLKHIEICDTSKIEYMEQINNDDSILVCKKCGSQDIQTLMWVNPNTYEVGGKLSFEDSENNWCKICCEHTALTSLEQYKLNQLEDNE